MKRLTQQVRFALRCPDAVETLAQHLQRHQKARNSQINWGARRVPLSKGRHHGGYASLFLNQPLLRFESELERRVLKALASMPQCMALATQPLTLRFQFGRGFRLYTPDILLVLDDVPTAWIQLGIERFTLIEVKPLDIVVSDDLWKSRSRALRRGVGMPLIRFPLREEG